MAGLNLEWEAHRTEHQTQFGHLVKVATALSGGRLWCCSARQGAPTLCSCAVAQSTCCARWSWPSGTWRRAAAWRWRSAPPRSCRRRPRAWPGGCLTGWRAGRRCRRWSSSPGGACCGRPGAVRALPTLKRPARGGHLHAPVLRRLRCLLIAGLGALPPPPPRWRCRCPALVPAIKLAAAEREEGVRNGSVALITAMEGFEYVEQQVRVLRGSRRMVACRRPRPLRWRPRARRQERPLRAAWPLGAAAQGVVSRPVAVVDAGARLHPQRRVRDACACLPCGSCTPTDCASTSPGSWRGASAPRCASRSTR